MNYPGDFGFFFQFLISFIDLWVNETSTYWKRIPSQDKSFSYHALDLYIFIQMHLIINHTPKMKSIRVDLFGFFGIDVLCKLLEVPVHDEHILRSDASFVDNKCTLDGSPS
ncbi:MAG: hypothetical protein DRQ01_05280 [Ignavibacteriae bacterium]|nr:MAG: hypothetical protein DRQ01_05280 [Ignavibacteriota bacterium]